MIGKTISHYKIFERAGEAEKVTNTTGAVSVYESTDEKWLFYMKHPFSIWKIPVDGGEEQLVHDDLLVARAPPAVHHGSW